ncbi:hypothetical protein [Enterococcus casseliflavus]|uniref:hypothetical protein n=1 Tax=Enterococcus casseliflavus TaxID=37734 RepID=UPI0035CB0625
MAIIEVSKQITNYLDSEQTASAPANPVEGQRWTDTSKSPPVAMIYTEGDWKPERLSVEVLDPDFYRDLEDTKTEVAAAIEKAEAAEKAGKDAQAAGEAAQSAASEAKQAGENAANLATQATLDAQEAKAKADAIQIDVNGLVSDVATINGTVTAISSKANEAYEKAAAVEGRTATLETSVTGLTGRMTDIETTSTSTTKKLNELVVTVDGQKQTIATVTTTADSALNKANVLETTVDGVTQTLTSLETTANSALSKVNTVSSTVDGHTQLIASTKITADSALSKAVATETTVNGLKTTVSSVEITANSALSKALQVEATAKGLVTTVTNVQADISDIINRFPDSKFINQSPKPTTEGTNISIAYDSGGLVINNTNTTTRQRVYWGTTPVALTIGKTYYVKAYLNTGTYGGSIEIGTSGGENIKLTPSAGVATWVQGVIKATTYSAFSVWVEASKALRLRELYIYEAATDVTSSQITQLETDINLKVDKDGVIAQINVSSEGILIDGKYTWITGTTKIDNAVIKTAHIADLAVSNGKIANLAVTEGKIGNLAVTTAKIADLAVNNAKIASLDAAKINTGYLAAARIAASSITTDKLNVATLSAITANLGNVTAGTINGLEIIGGSYAQSATMTDPNSGKSGISEIKLASGVLTNSFNSTDSSVSRQTTLSSGVLRFLNLGSEFGRLQSNSDKGSSTVPALEISGTFMAITSSQRGWINLSANGIFEGNTYRGYSVDAGSNTGNYVGFNRNSSDKMNFFAGKTADGTKRMGSDDLYASSGSGKALHITSGGSIVAYSSSERFKEYIEIAADVTPKSLLNLDLKSWIYKSSHSLVSVGEPIRRVYGLIAEDVERVGLNQYVERDINGRVEGYKPELWTITIPILKEHEESIETLKQKVQKLEEKIEALQAA